VQSFDGRRCKRFKVQDGYVVLGDLYGEIIDVSFGGLAFRYTSLERELVNPSGFGIIIGGETFYLDHVPLETVSDIPWNGEEEGQRRRSMQFGRLTQEQLSRLAAFIRRHGLLRAG